VPSASRAIAPAKSSDNIFRCFIRRKTARHCRSGRLRARATGRFEAEGWCIRKGGARFFASVVIDNIYEDGALVGFAKITRDITERMQARSALSQSETNFRLLAAV
jgi:PAS domain S-box-containing protein